jgi:hypothetical protein
VYPYNPWTAAGTLSPSFHVLGELSGGSCFTQLSSPNIYGQTTVANASIADPSNQNAWRCTTAQGSIWDPCFAPPGTSNVSQLACAVTPYDQDDVYLLSLSQPLPSSSTGFEPTGGVWPLELALSNGVDCEVIQGTASVPGGNYGCTSGSASNPNTSSEPWTVSYWSNGATTPVTVAVTTVWE